MNLPALHLLQQHLLAYFAVGGLIVGLLPGMRNEVLKYPNISRSQGGSEASSPSDGSRVPGDQAAVLYSMLYRAGYGVISGRRWR